MTQSQKESLLSRFSSEKRRRRRRHLTEMAPDGHRLAGFRLECFVFLVFVTALQHCPIFPGAVAAVSPQMPESTVPTIPFPDGWKSKGPNKSEEKTKGLPFLLNRFASNSAEMVAPCSIDSKFTFRILNETKGAATKDRVCFELVNLLADWAQANATCVVRGGHLARPSNPSETRAIEDMLREHPVSRDYWIDANDMNNEGEWRWSDGAGPIFYSNWRPGKPINSTRYFSRDCAELHRNFDWQWNDKDCVDQNFFVCQFLVGADEGVPVPTSSFRSPTIPTLLPTTTSPLKPSSPRASRRPSASDPKTFTTKDPSAYKTKTTTSKSLPDFLVNGSSLFAASFSPALPDPPIAATTIPLLEPLTSAQIGLLALCSFTLTLLAAFAILYAVPTLRAKLKRQGSSSPPSSPSSSQIDSSSNSSNSSSNSSSSSSSPWSAVLKCFSSQQLVGVGGATSAASTTTFTNGLAPVVVADDRTFDPASSRPPEVVVTDAAPARRPSPLPHAFRLPSVSASPRLPSFNIKRLTAASSQKGRRGLGVSNPVFMADSLADDEVPTLADARLEIAVEPADEKNTSQPETPASGNPEPDSGRLPRISAFARNIFMREDPSGEREPSRFKYEKF